MIKFVLNMPSVEGFFFVGTLFVSIFAVTEGVKADDLNK